VYVLEAIRLLVESLDEAHLGEQRRLVTHQADLVVAASAHADLLPDDRALVEAAHAKRFAAA
jgi:hypothetical protein